MTSCVGDHDKAQPAASGYLCQRCRNRLSSLLVQIPSLAAWLHENIAPGAGNGPKISGSREDPIPLRSDVMDFIGPDSWFRATVTPPPKFLLWDDATFLTQFDSWKEARKTRTALLAAFGLEDDEAAWYRWQIRATDPGGSDQVGEESFRAELHFWITVIHDERDLAWPAKDDLASDCRWIHSQLDWIVCQPWVDAMLDQLSDVSRKAERLAPRDAERRILKPPCPSCDLKALVFTRGVGIRCESKMGGCGRSWEDDNFDRLLIVLGYEALEVTMEAS